MDLKANAFQLEFKYIPAQQITLLTSIHGRVVLFVAWSGESLPPSCRTNITPIPVYHPFLKGQRCYWLCCLVSNAPNQQHLFCLTFRSDDVRVSKDYKWGVSLSRRPIIVVLHDLSPTNRHRW